MIKRSMLSQQGPAAIQLLQKLVPPHAVIHIGAGTGMGEMHQWYQWGVSHALIIDAEPERLDWAKQRCADQPGWQIQTAVLTETAGEIDYHQASNPEEDGILPPEQLAAIWPNLRTTEKETRQGQRLDQLLAETGNPAFDGPAHVWTFIDCLPALPILKGAGESCDRWSVLCIRVLLQPIAAATHSAQLETIASYLLPKGFKCIDVSPGNHPALGYAIFVKDWHVELNQKIETLTRSAAALGQARDAQTQLAADRQAEIQQISADRDTQAQTAADRQAEIQQISAERDTQAKTAAERQARIDALTQERDQHAQQSSERQAQIDQLTQSNIALSNEKDALLNDKAALEAQRSTLEKELAALSQTRDAQTQLATQRKTDADQFQAKLQQTEARITQLESELTERDTRQHMLNDEMIRAEAQIELIKDLLLREPGL